MPICQGHDVTPQQMYVLTELLNEPGQSAGQLSDRAGILPTNFSAVCHRLEERGLIRRNRSARDRRAFELYITDAGRALLGEIDEDVRRRYGPVFESEPPETCRGHLAGFRALRGPFGKAGALTMFGYVVANLEDATGPEKERYRAVYCGLCRALGRRCGQRCRLALTYDMAFLVLLLGSLYEPEETRSRARCVAHPLKAHDFVRNRFTDYAADVTVALAYHKCRDDWSDERKAAARVGQAVLAGAYRRVRERMPRQCAAIERELAAIDALEQAGEPAPDEAARCFGRCMGELS